MGDEREGERESEACKHFPTPFFLISAAPKKEWKKLTKKRKTHAHTHAVGEVEEILWGWVVVGVDSRVEKRKSGRGKKKS